MVPSFKYSLLCIVVSIATTPPGEETGTDDSSFLDSLVRQGTDMIATFNLEVLELLHQNSLECHMNLSNVDMKYQKRMMKLIKYHQSMEKVVSAPNFAEFSNEDRPQVEANFHGTLRHMEKMRNTELLKVQTRCNSTRDDWLKGRFLSAVEYAKRILLNDRGQYRALMAEMQAYRARMKQHLTSCQGNRHSFGQLYCYVEELEILLGLIDNFFAVMENVALMYYGDDEDLNDGSGVDDVATDDDLTEVATDGDLTEESRVSKVDGVGKATTNEVPDNTPSSPIKIKLPPGFLRDGPIIIQPHGDDATPTNVQPTPTLETVPVNTPAVEPSPAASPTPLVGSGEQGQSGDGNPPQPSSTPGGSDDSAMPQDTLGKLGIECMHYTCYYTHGCHGDDKYSSLSLAS
jgi:hypothetical protein